MPSPMRLARPCSPPWPCPAAAGCCGPVFASRVLQAIMAVEGVAALEGLSFDGSAFAEVARIPAAGAYFDFAGGGVRINGRLAG